MTNIDELIPAVAIHPGVILKDELEARRMKQSDFAKKIQLNEAHLSMIINGKRHYSVEIAVRIGKALRTDEFFWWKLRADYERDLLLIEWRKHHAKNKV